MPRLSISQWLTIIGMLIGGVLAFGVLHGRLSSLENQDIDRRLSEAMAEVEAARVDAIGQIEAAKGQAEQDLEKLTDPEALRSSVSAESLPVGTVVASVLEPSTFQAQHGDGWVLAAGQDIIGTKLSELWRKEKSPDLRGVFLRGMNHIHGADPNKNREAGSLQPGQPGNHTHTVALHSKSASSKGGTNFLALAGNAATFTTGGLAGQETRPTNAAMYFYIRVE